MSGYFRVGREEAIGSQNKYLSNVSPRCFIFSMLGTISLSKRVFVNYIKPTILQSD